MGYNFGWNSWATLLLRAKDIFRYCLLPQTKDKLFLSFFSCSSFLIPLSLYLSVSLRCRNNTTFPWHTKSAFIFSFGFSLSTVANNLECWRRISITIPFEDVHKIKNCFRKKCVWCRRRCEWSVWNENRIISKQHYAAFGYCRSSNIWFQHAEASSMPSEIYHMNGGLHKTISIRLFVCVSLSTANTKSNRMGNARRNCCYTTNISNAHYKWTLYTRKA